MEMEGKKSWFRLNTVLRGIVVLAVAGAAIFCFERYGDAYMSRLSSYVAGKGSLGPLVFMAVNVVATVLLIPQTIFTVTAGVLFGWKWGAVYASVGMTAGAACSFFISRYCVREQVEARFAKQYVYKRMQRLSRSHPLHVISLSRLIPVVPFPIASYLLGVTEVRSLPYVLLTWCCMLPETFLLASGGHLLHSGLVHGKSSWEALTALLIAGLVVGVAGHRMKRKFEEGEERG